jgi:DNA-binding NarL/FixJ family response regulator
LRKVENQSRMLIDLYHRLSDRQLEILRLSAYGKMGKEIAHILDLSEHTVKAHKFFIVKKLYAANMTHAVAKAITTGLITIEI